jgi:hypothetical protein
MDIQSLKFSLDNSDNFKHLLTKVDEKTNTATQQKRIELLSNSLKITKDITPKLFNIIDGIEKKLKIKHTNIEYYVYNDVEINASCFSVDDEIKLIVLLSSGLVNIMQIQELAFVIGHELGHYLFEHLQYHNLQDSHILSKYSQSTEISADRVGLICADNINIAIRAIIKTISGLKDELISHNLHTFLHQHNEINSSNILATTHPFLPTRAKALMLFSMSEPYYDWLNKEEKAPINRSKLDFSIEKYLTETSLKFVSKQNQEILSKLKIWLMLKIFFDSGYFGEDEIKILHNEFDGKKVVGIVNYANSHTKQQVNNKYYLALENYQNIDKQSKEKFITHMLNIFKSLKYNYIEILDKL